MRALISVYNKKGIVEFAEKLSHQKEAKKFGIEPIDMVACNFYPPEKGIDIGGPTMARAAAKNYKYVTVLVDPKDYPKAVDFLERKGNIPLSFRLELARKVFLKTARYDRAILRFMGSRQSKRYG